MNIMVHSQTAVKHLHKKWHTIISGRHLTHIAFSFSCYFPPLKKPHLLLRCLQIWSQKVNQPGLETTSSVRRLFSTQIKSSVSLLCVLTNSLTDTNERAGLERNAEWSLTWARPPPEVCMPRRCCLLLMLLLLCIERLPIAHTLQNLRGQHSKYEYQQLLYICWRAECNREGSRSSDSPKSCCCWFLSDSSLVPVFF